MCAATALAVVTGLIGCTDTSPAVSEWKLEFSDDFDNRSGPVPEGENNSAWGSYSGVPGGTKWAYWDPANAVIRNGELLLKTTRRGDRYITAGVGNMLQQTYGRWEVRMRMPYSRAIKFVIQLWPVKDWPPEIDFAEGGGRNGYPDGFAAYFHWGDPESQKPPNKQQTVDRIFGLDMNDWHTVGVEWRKGELDYLIDGRVWGTVRSPNVPDEPMWLAIQTEATGPAADSDDPPSQMQVDSVRIWSWLNPEATGTPNTAPPSQGHHSVDTER